MSCSVLLSCRCCRCCCCCNVPRTSRPQSNFVFAFVGLRSYRKRGPKRSPQFTVIAVVRANSCDIKINQVWKRVSGNTCFQNNVSANRCLICNNWKVPFTRRLQSNFVLGWSYCCWLRYVVHIGSIGQNAPHIWLTVVCANSCDINQVWKRVSANSVSRTIFQPTCVWYATTLPPTSANRCC